MQKNASPFKHAVEESLALFKEELIEEKKGDLKEKLRQARYLGNLLRKYLLFETDDSLLVINQHAELDGSMTRQYSGTGLGLTMAKRIIEAHGSQVNVESTVGQGSRFEFTMPSFHQAITEMTVRQSNPKQREASNG